MKIAVISHDEKHLLEIVRVLRERHASDVVNVFSGNIENIIDDSDLAQIDVLIIDQPSVEGGDLQRLERLSHLFSRLAFIVLSRQHTPDFLIQAMRAGIREVLPFPVNASSLAPALQRIEDKLDSKVQANGKVLAFVSCKGGSGATFLSTNLGYALATQEKKRVALIDLNLQFGDASLFVSDQKPLATLSQVCQQIHRLDASFLSSSMVNITPNYAVLAAPEDPAHANDVKPEHLDAILKLARRQYDFILLDVGRSLDAVNIRALDQADMIFPIIQTTLPYLRDGKRLLALFKSLDYRKDKIHLIVNRHEKNSEIRLQDLQSAFGLTEFRVIPNHYEAAANSVAQGVPVLKLFKSSPVSKALLEFSKSLAGYTSDTPKSWVSRVFSPRVVVPSQI